jgi:hypothetical protein
VRGNREDGNNALRADERRLVGAILDLAAQPEDLDVDRAVVDVVVQAARLEQLVAREDAPGRLEERHQQRVLAVGELDVATVGRAQLAGAGVQLPAPEAEGAHRLAAARGALLLGAPQDRLDARQQLALAERLGDVVVGAQLQAHDAVHLFLASGEDDDRQVEGFAQPPRDGEAVLVGQLEVEDDQVDDLDREHAVHVGSGFRYRDLEVVLGEVFLDQVADGDVVVDDKDMGFHGRLELSFGAF